LVAVLGAPLNSGQKPGCAKGNQLCAEHSLSCVATHSCKDRYQT